MATITRYVNPGSSGGDGTTNATSGAGAAYVSLNAFEAAEDANLSGSGNLIEVRCAGSTADTTEAFFLGWTMSATEYVHIIGDAHTGIYDTNHYRMEITDAGSCITTNESGNYYVHITGIQFYNTYTSDHSNIIYVDSYGTIYISKCILKLYIGDNYKSITGISSAYKEGSHLYAWNNILYSTDSGNHGVTGISWNRGNATIYNCTVNIDKTATSETTACYKMNNASYTMTVINCIGVGADDNFVQTAGTLTGDYNVSDLASDAPGDNSVQGTPTWAGSGDYHLGATDTVAKDAGNGATPESTFTDDIDGDTRPTGAGTWDIGADEYVAEANYSMGNYSSLPTDDADLENIYTAQNITDVATNDTNRVSQGANSGDYAIHQYKNVVGKQTILDWDGQCSLAPASSPVYLQIYNRSGTPAWETLDSKSTGVADSDFTLTATINDTTNYRDGSGVICCRIYQRNI